MDLTIAQTVIALLLIAALVAIVARRLHLPYTVGLVITGMILAFLPFSQQLSLTKDLLFDILLPPLIFEAALSLRWQELRRDLDLILILANAGVLISALITAAGMHALLHWPWWSAAAFGILIAATDPVSVIAVFREAKVSGRLRLLVEAESLFNDGTAAAGFSIVLTAGAYSQMSSFDIFWTALVTIGGGLLCGALVAGVTLLLVGRTQDHFVELTFTTVAAYGSFLLAEHFKMSGVLATLTAGMMLGNLGMTGIVSEQGKVAVQAFWEYTAFLANSLVFLLIGVREASENFRHALVPSLVGIGIVLLARAAAVYPICSAYWRSPRRVPLSHQNILFWGGLRGGLALALALGLPPEMPLRADIVTVSFAIVAFSLFVQGLTITPFLHAIRQPAGGAILTRQDTSSPTR
jgi:CPA1 family monovalent cation:H+ antiporter